MLKKLKEVRILENYRVFLRFDDGVEGEMNFSSKPLTGVYEPWQDYNYFLRGHIGEYGDLVWDNQVDFSADSLWLQITVHQ